MHGKLLVGFVRKSAYFYRPLIQSAFTSQLPLHRPYNSRFQNKFNRQYIYLVGMSRHFIISLFPLNIVSLWRKHGQPKSFWGFAVVIKMSSTDYVMGGSTSIAWQTMAHIYKSYILFMDSTNASNTNTNSIIIILSSKDICARI